MKKKIKKNYNRYYIGIAVLVFLLVAGSVVKANVSFRDEVKSDVVDKVANELLAEGQEASFGGSTSDDWNVGGNLTVAGSSAFTGAFTSSGESSLSATTTIPRLDASLQYDLNWSNATSSGETTVSILVNEANTGNDLICTDLWIDISTDRGIWLGNFTSGTTTDTGDISLTATSTATLIGSTEVSTTTIGVYNKQDHEGTHLGDVWIWGSGEKLVVTDTFNIQNATSSASFTAAGGFTGVGKLHVNCRNRY